ncbi:MAG: nuclear transport factor 2 family protein [Actinobacteria bacterium]|nr:nuclear transport factor 2 family protein [Actinomycetota bacterium]
MEESAEVWDGMLRFYDRLSASDVAAFDDVVSSHPATLVIGTAPEEFVRERARLMYGFEMEGARITPGADPVGYAEGDLGWVIDEPTFAFPGDVTVKTRLTGILHREDGKWKLVHMHVSVGVPDEKATELQARWEREAASQAEGQG